MKNHQLGSLLLSAILLFFTVFVFPDSPSEIKINQLAENQNLQQIRAELFKLINRERKNLGLKTLEIKRELEIIAQKHSSKMAQKRKMSHYFPNYKPVKERMRKANLYFIRIGENLAFSDFPAAQFIHEGLMESSSHRKNILQPKFTHCGLGIAETDKKIFVTQIYAQLFNIFPENEIEIRLKEEIELWFAKSFSYRFLFHSRSQNKVRENARNSIIRSTYKSSARYRQKYYNFSIIYPDLEIIKSRLKEEIGKINLEALSLGIAVGRNKKFPGGTYAVTAFLFGHYYQNLSSEELVKIIVQTINQQRTNTGRSLIKLNSRLSRRAQKTLRSVYRSSRQQFKTTASYFTLTFPLVNPRLLPVEVQKFLQKNCSEIGIGLLLRTKKNSSKHRFWVCIILKKR